MKMKSSYKNGGFIKFKKYKDKVLFRGGLFRVDGKYPYEEKVDFMIFENALLSNPRSEYGLMVSSGYNAGSVLVLLPDECLFEGGGISRKWIIKNWHKWIYDCDIGNVYYASEYEIKY